MNDILIFYTTQNFFKFLSNDFWSMNVTPSYPTFCTFGHFVIFSRILYRCVYWMLYMLYSVLNTLLPHVGRKSVFLFMYLLHVLQYPQSTTSPTKKILRQKETTFSSHSSNKHSLWKHEHPKSKIFLYVY